METFNWSTLRYFMFTRKTVENLSWKTLPYFMSKKEKTLTGELGIIHVHEVENFDQRTLRYFMSTKWKSSTGKLKDISCPQSGTV